MARFVTLNYRAQLRGLATGAFGFTAMSMLSLQATTPAMTPPPALPPPPPPDTFGQYGKILSPSDQVGHPLKLKMPLPGVGEVKVPNQDEMNMRDKLEQLAKLSDADIRTQLDKWPAYGKMSLRDQGTMLQRIQDFRDYRTNVAKAKAHDLGLLTLLPDQQARFEQEYWDKRLQMDRDLAKQFGPIFKAREQKMMDELYREYSAISQGPIAAGKPPAPAKPAPQAPKPPATPVVTTSTNPAPTMEPVAQAPR